MDKIVSLFLFVFHEESWNLGHGYLCVVPDSYKTLQHLKCKQLNAYITTKPKAGYTTTFNKSSSGNPNEFLGVREDLTPKKMSEFV